METNTMVPEVNKSLYPDVEPYNTGFLKVSDIHTIYYEQSGNPDGNPVVFLHGGPGGGTSPSKLQNTTWDLIKDIEKLREHLNVPEWLVFGGSWGSTLALAYSESHPDKVTGLVLRGIFLLRKKEINWFYEGGAAAIFPDADKKSSFKLLKADVSAQTFVKIGFGVEKKISEGDGLVVEGLPEWRTKPRLVRMHFEVLAKVDGNKVVPERIVQVNPVIAEDSVGPSVLMGNVSMSKVPIVHHPPNPFTL